MQKLIFIILFLILMKGGKSQVRPLGIGDLFSPPVFTQVINHSSSMLDLATYKGKLVIFDFWASYCVGCIRALPKLYSLQQKYADRLAIFVVTTQGRAATAKFWHNHKGTKDYPLPVITADSLLRQYFPFGSLPHEVWIGADGKVKAITGADYITEENILALLTTNKVSWPVKTVETAFDESQSLLMWNTATATAPLFVYHTAFTGSMPGIRLYKGVQSDSQSHSRRHVLINLTLPGLYYTILQQMGWQQINQRMELKLADSSRFFYKKGSGYELDWNLKNRYCYEAVFPDTINAARTGYMMIEDLNRFSGLNGYITRKFTDCWVICDLKVPTDITAYSKAVHTLQYASIEKLTRGISLHTTIPVVNESKMVAGFPIVLANEEMNDLIKLNIRLAMYGLCLIKSKREIEVFVLKEGGQ